MRLRRVLLAALLMAVGCRKDAPEPAAATASETPQVEAVCDTTPAVAAWGLRGRPDGAFELRLEQTTLLEIRHGGFRAPEKPAKPAVTRTPTDDGSLAFEVTFDDLPVVIRGHATHPQPTTIRVDYEFETTQPLRDVPGVGVQFDVDHATWGLSADALSVEAGAGVRLDLPQRGSIAIAFDTDAPPETRLAKGATGRARSAWLTGDTPPGITKTSMTLTLPGPVGLETPTALRYDDTPQQRWHRDMLRHDAWPVDLSALNEAHGRAGSHGRVVVDGEDLRFEDGTPARFWGTNLAASALFEADDATIEREAERLRALGYNLVRLHHHDSAWAGRHVFDTAGGTTQVLDAGALERLDKWIDTLAEAGIYVFVDLHTGREFLPGDAIPGYADMLGGPHERQARGVSYVNPRVEALMADFTEAFLSRKNRHTGAPWSKEPAIVGVLLTNENDLTHHFGAGFMPGSGRDTHVAMFRALGAKITDELGLPETAVGDLRRPGPGKVLLAEVQHRWDARARAALSGLGVRTPIATTNVWGHESLLSLPPLAFGDIIDVHVYGEAEALSTNPHRQPNWLHEIAMAQVAGTPLTVSEWATPKPAADRFTAPLWLAAVASLQGWDALMAYNYAQRPLADAPSRPTKWDQRVDPAQLGLAPTAALMYRRGDVAGAKHTIALSPTWQDLWNEHASPRSRAALRTAAERSRVVVVLPDHPKLDWDGSAPAPRGARVVADLDEDLLPSGGTSVRADTGEFERDWAQGVLRIDAPKVQAASGWIGGKTITLGHFEVKVDTAKATVVAIALDDLPLERSERILITAVARAEPDADGSVRSEPVTGSIALRTQSELEIAPLRPSSRADRTPADAPTTRGVRDGPWVRLTLPHVPTHWFIVSR